MCIYYSIHSLTKKADGEKDGPKNARTFLFGSMIYIIIYMFLSHYGLKNKQLIGLLKTGFYLLLLADLATMAYIYKSYYGRLITNEILSTDKEDKDWKYNEKKHEYSLKTETDKKIENEIEKVQADYNMKEINKLKEKLETVDEKENI